MSGVSRPVGSTLDFQGLGELRAQAQRDQRGALRETARQFEAMFLQTIMATMREAGFKSDLVESSSMETFQAMHDKEIALSMTRRGGLGLADMLVDQMERNKIVPAAQELAKRGAGFEGNELKLSRPADSSGLPLQAQSKSLPVNKANVSLDLPKPPEKWLPLHKPLTLKRAPGGEQ